MVDGYPNPLDGSANASVPSFHGQTDIPASGDVFTTRRGDINARPAGDAPPADNTTFRVNKRKGGTTTAAFIKKIGE